MKMSEIKKLNDSELLSLKETTRNKINALPSYAIKAKRDLYKFLDKLNHEQLVRKLKNGNNNSNT